MNEIQWLIGAIIALVSMIGGIIVRDRQIMKEISEGDKELQDRITKVQSEYVRRDDLNGHIQSIENSVNQMREEQRQTNHRIDSLLTLLAKQGN
jgi:peptidoglycan hydrolase CwlO-like protein